jgi:hypothetical protein
LLTETMGLVRFMTERSGRGRVLTTPPFSGRDVLGAGQDRRAGKTVAFLLPAIERVLRANSGHVDGSDVGVDARHLPPTRELADPDRIRGGASG